MKGRTFYYARSEQESNRGQNGSDIDPATASAINALLTMGADPRMRDAADHLELFPYLPRGNRSGREAKSPAYEKYFADGALRFTNNREAGDAFNTSGLADASARGSTFTSDSAISAR